MNHDKSILGIHIDDDFLNIVHLGHAANGLQIHNWIAEPLEAGTVTDGLIIDTEVISQKIRDFAKANQLKTRKVIMSLACSTVRLKPCEFPVQTDEQLQKQIEDQVGKYSLFEGQKVIFDYCTFKEPARSPDKQIVLQAVTTRQISDACLATVRRTGLNLARIEPAIMPIIKLVFNKQAPDPQAVSLLLALDSASSNLSVFRNGVPQLCRNLSVGTKDLSKDKDSFAYLTEQMDPVLEFARSLANSQQLVLKVAAACNSEKAEAIVTRIKQNLTDVTTEQIDSARIASQFNVQDADWGAVPFFAFACALAAFGVCEFDGQLNLISQESLTKQKIRKELSLTAKVIAAVVLLSIAALVPLKMKIKSVEAASSEIGAKVTDTIPMRDKITGLEKQIRQLKEKWCDYDAADKKLIDISWPKVMQAIGDTVPDKVRIVDIASTDSGDFTLLGEASAERYVYKFVKELQNNEIVESAKVEEIEYDNNNGQILVDYKITCKIRMRQSDL